jgi:hypothetical protein
MRILSSTISLTIVASLGLWSSACTVSQPTQEYRSAVTGEVCEPNDTFVPMSEAEAHEHGHGNTSPTGIPGDNLDDNRSGKVDCYYDGNSGQGDDKKHPCPGCDDQGCCQVPPDDVGADAGSDDPEPPPAEVDAGGNDPEPPPPAEADAGPIIIP